MSRIIMSIYLLKLSEPPLVRSKQRLNVITNQPDLTIIIFLNGCKHVALIIKLQTFFTMYSIIICLLLTYVSKD